MYHTDTFVKLNRKILDWKWYQDGTTFRVFIHLILKANVFDNDFQNIKVHRGQLVTSYGRIASDLGFYKGDKISVQPIRTAIKHLKTTGEINAEPISCGLLITINNYNTYQGENTYHSSHNNSANSELTGNKQEVNSQLTEDKQQYNKLNKYNKSYKSKTERQKELLPLSVCLKMFFLLKKKSLTLRVSTPKHTKGKSTGYLGILLTVGKGM